MQIWTVQPEEDGRTLRDILLNSMHLSWSALKSAKWNGQILRNGLAGRMRDKVQAGDRLEVIFPEKAPGETKGGGAQRAPGEKTP